MQMRIDVFTAQQPAQVHAETMQLDGWTADLRHYTPFSFHDPQALTHAFRDDAWVVVATK